MRTDSLIMLLSQDAPRPLAWWRRAAPVLFVAVAVSAAVFTALLDARSDLMLPTGALPTLGKWLAAGLVAGLAGLAMFSLRRPEGAGRHLDILAVVVAALAALAIAWDVWTNGAEGLGARALGSSAAACLFFVTTLSLPILAGGLLILKAGAVTAPGRAGFAAGLAAAGVATVLYAAHCTEDSPLFVIAWYGLAVLLVGIVGAVVGRAVLRW